MARSKTEVVEQKVPETAVFTTPPPQSLLESAVEHMATAADLLRSKGGKHAEACAYIAAQLDRWREKAEALQ